MTANPPVGKPDPRAEIARIVAEAPPVDLSLVAAAPPREETLPRPPRRGTCKDGGLEGGAENQGGGAPPGEEPPPAGEPDDPGRIPPGIIEACALEERNDVGNGRRLLHHFGDRILHVRDVGWHAWTGTHWAKEGGDEAVQRFAQLTAARIRLERSFLILKPEQEAVEAGEDAKSALAKLAAERLERSEEDRKAEEKRLAALILEGQKAERALAARKGDRVKFSIGSGNTARVKNMINEALPHKTVAISALDADPDAFNVENGTIRFLRVVDEDDPDDTRKVARLKWVVRLDPHDPADRITKCAPVSYDALAPCAEWDAFLAKVQPLAHMRRFLRDFHGYGLTGRTSIQGFLFNSGTGANGKSSFIEAVMRTIGAYGDTLNPESLTGTQQRQGGQATPDLADLPGVRLLRVSELAEKAKLQEHLVKTLTGGEPIKARHNYAPRFFTFHPVFKASMSGNAKPDINDISEGFWRRIMIVPWEVTIPAAERKDFETMQEIFARERAGILNWLIEGALAFLNAGSKLDIPEEVVVATAEHREEMDPIGQFLNSCCERVEGAKMPAGQLYAYYEAWCRESGYAPKHQTTFGKTVPKHGWVKLHQGTRFYLDMVMHPDAPKPDHSGGPLAPRAPP